MNPPKLDAKTDRQEILKILDPGFQEILFEFHGFFILAFHMNELRFFLLKTLFLTHE
jgi:hypothetical protein